MLRTLAGVTGVLTTLAVLVGGAALAATVRTFGRRAPLAPRLFGRRAPLAPRLFGRRTRLAPRFLGRRAPLAPRFLGRRAPLAPRFLGRHAPLAPRSRRSRAVAASGLILAVAVGLATAGATVAASARQSVDDAFAALPADLVVRSTTPIDPATVDAIRAIRSVDLAASGATAPARVNGTTATVATWDDNGAANLLLAHHATSGTIETLAAGQLLMSDRLADRYDTRVGDRVTVTFPGRDPRDFRLVGLYAASPLDPGIVLPWSDWSAAPVTAMLVKLAPATPVTDVEGQINALLAGRRDVSVLPTDRAPGGFEVPLGRVMAVMWGLLAVTGMLAAVGLSRSIQTTDRPDTASRISTASGTSTASRTNTASRTGTAGTASTEGGASVGVEPGATAEAHDAGGSADGANRGVTARPRSQARATRAVARACATASVFASAAGIGGGVILGATITWALGDRGITGLVVPWAQLAALVVGAALAGALAAPIRPAPSRDPDLRWHTRTRS